MAGRRCSIRFGAWDNCSIGARRRARGSVGRWRCASVRSASGRGATVRSASAAGARVGRSVAGRKCSIRFGAWGNCSIGVRYRCGAWLVGGGAQVFDPLRGLGQLFDRRPPAGAGIGRSVAGRRCSIPLRGAGQLFDRRPLPVRGLVGPWRAQVFDPLRGAE